MVGITERHSERVAEYSGSFLEGYVMLREIDARLGVIPFELQHLRLWRGLRITSRLSGWTQTAKPAGASPLQPPVGHTVARELVGECCELPNDTCAAGRGSELRRRTMHRTTADGGRRNDTAGAPPASGRAARACERARWAGRQMPVRPRAGGRGRDYVRGALAERSGGSPPANGRAAHLGLGANAAPRFAHTAFQWGAQRWS